MKGTKRTQLDTQNGQEGQNRILELFNTEQILLCKHIGYRIVNSPTLSGVVHTTFFLREVESEKARNSMQTTRNPGLRLTVVA